MKNTKAPLKPRDLVLKIPRSWMPFDTTEEVPLHNGVIGQERAMEAVSTGLKIPTRGYNIFAMGEAGSGKTSTLKKLLKERAQGESVPSDICYVYNFSDGTRPVPIFLPPGQGKHLARDMEKLVRDLKKMIPMILVEGASGHLRAGIMAASKQRADEITGMISQVAQDLGLVVTEQDNALMVQPLYRNRPISEEQMEKLPEKTRRRLEKKIIEFQEKAESLAYARRQLEIAHDEQVKEAETRAISPFVEERVKEISDKYRHESDGVPDYLEQLTRHCVENYRLFVSEPSSDEEDDSPLRMLAQQDDGGKDDPEVLYRVNVLVDRTDAEGAPVVIERFPTSQAICGAFEYKETAGGLVTDHTLLRKGALHEANGGYLLIQAHELLSHEHAWEHLKRALRHKELIVDESMGHGDRPKLAGALRPLSIPLNVKVVMVGAYDIYYLLSREDEDFNRLFKIMADFEPSMPLSKDKCLQLAGFFRQVCEEEAYLPIHRSGFAAIIRYAARRAQGKDRLITRQGALLDLLAESNVHAVARRARAITQKDVDMAIAASDRRHGSVCDSFFRQIDRGNVIIQTSGYQVGQINGMAVYDVGGHAFGIPVRITARTYVGRRGVVNIDREVNLSGAIHDKGSLILIGYLGGRYALEGPLGFSASITFEQSYDEIDGDSASCAELYAMLSSLSGCPLNQGIAVTGSVNQLGEIQPIGGVNEKIEGVFNVCKRRGLTGKEGVIIPVQNVRNLVLREEVVDAVKAGQFHIYAISSVDEGIEILTGVKAGNWSPERGWATDSINEMVQERLQQLVTLNQRDIPLVVDSNI